MTGKLVPRRPVAAALAMGVASWVGAATVSVQLSLVPPPPGEGETVAATLVAEAGGQQREWVAPAPGVTVVELPEGVGWRVWAQVAGWWCEPKTVVPGVTKAVALHLVPAGELRLRWQPPENRPAHLGVRARPTPRREGDAPPWGEAQVSCPLWGEAYRCAVPGGALDLRLGADGVVPLYLWGVEVPAGGVTEVAPWAPMEGASVSGFVVGFPAPGQVAVALVASGGEAPGEGRGPIARVNERGFFQFAGVSPGQYVVEARASGLRARSGGVWVSPGLESHLGEALRLLPLGALRVVLTGAFPTVGTGWTVSLVGDPRGGGPEGWGETQVVEEGGVAQFRDLLAGGYHLTVRDAAGTTWASEDVEVRGGEQVVRVPLAAVVCRGTLRLGGEPSGGRLMLFAEGRTVTLTAQGDGTFQGVVPGEGRYRVTVQPAGQGASVRGDEVEVPPPGVPCELAIELSAGRLVGTAVEEDGQPVAGALVLARRTGGNRDEVRGASARDGSFRLAGLAPGQWTVEASRQGRWSEPVQVEVSEKEGPPLRLVLKSGGEFVGRVVSPRGGVAGAAVSAMPRRGGWGELRVAEAHSQRDGGFVVRLLGRAEAASLLVVAPGLGVELQAAGPHREVGDIALTTEGGAVQLSGGPGCPNLSCLGRVWVVRGAARWPLISLLGSVGQRLGDGEVVLTSLAPGPWSVCWGDLPTLFEVLDAGLPPPSSSCSGGRLPPRGVLRLQVGH